MNKIRITPTPSNTATITQSNTPSSTECPILTPTPTECLCYSYDITITQQDLDDATGNTEPNKDNNTVYVQWLPCNEGVLQEREYTTAGTYEDQICVSRNYLNSILLFYWKNDVSIFSGTSSSSQQNCCIDPTATPTATPNITPTITPSQTTTTQITPTTTATPTLTPSITSSNTPSSTPTNTPGISPSSTSTPTITPEISPSTTSTPTTTPSITNTQTQTSTPTSTIQITPSQTTTQTPSSTPPCTNTIYTHGAVRATCSDFCNENYLIQTVDCASETYAGLTIGDFIYGYAGQSGYIAYSNVSTDTNTGPFRIADIDGSGEILGIYVCSGGSCIPL